MKRSIPFKRSLVTTLTMSTTCTHSISMLAECVKEDHDFHNTLTLYVLFIPHRLPWIFLFQLAYTNAYG